MRTALPVVLHQDLLTSKNLVANVTNSESGAYQLGASEVLRTTVTERSGAIRIEATVTDLATERNRQIVDVAGSSSGGLLGPANLLAKRLNSEATSYSTKSDRALKDFAAALGTANAQGRIQTLSDAVAADPAFGLGYIGLIETLNQTGKDATATIEQAASHRASFTPVDRAHFDLLRARLLHQNLAAQARAAQAVLQVAANDVDAVAALASNRFLTGDAAGGERLVNRALELNPANSALRQQLAVGLLENRRFRDAEKILESMDNNPALLPALASCILLEGDAGRADTVFKRFLGFRSQNDALAPLLRASWLSLSGRMGQGIEVLTNLNSPNPEVKSVALAQISIWQLMAGDRTGAKQSAAAAMRLDPRPNSFAGIAVLMAAGDAPPASWREQVERLAANESARETLLGYGFFLNAHYAEAAQMWQQIVVRSGNTDLRARTMLAASLARGGNAESAKVPVQPFVPEIGDLYAAISFNEMKRLLGIRP